MICPALELLQKVAELMRRTDQLQGLRLMKFDEVYGRTYRGELSQLEAAEILGMSERTFRRWRDRFEAEGAEGLYDRRLGRVSARRAGVDEVVALLDLFDTRYRMALLGEAGCKARRHAHWHFWEKLGAKHDVTRRYNWVRLTLQAHGRIAPAPRRGVHRRKRPRRPMVGMMLHQDGSAHQWVPGQYWDLIVTMDDATSGDLFRLLRRRGGHHVELCGAAGGGVGHGGCSARFMQTGPRTIGTRRRPAARSTRTIQPRSDVPCSNSVLS